MKGIFVTLVFALTALQSQAATITTVTFDELSERPLDGVSVKGVTFRFDGVGTNFPVALFGTSAMAFGQTTLMSAPWAVGTTSGKLLMQFATPINSISFDVGLTTTLPLAEGYFVNLFSDTQLIDAISVPTTVNGPNPFQFSEAKFVYSAMNGPITSVSVTFNRSAAENFAFDNLSFTPVPLPKAAFLFSGGMLLLLVVGTKRSRRKTGADIFSAIAGLPRPSFVERSAPR